MAQELVTTKLRAPRTRPDLVARPRLREALDRSEEHRLTLISAPAGFGKTTLLGAWNTNRTSDGHSLAWLSLDDTDNDPARFLAYLVRSLQAVEEGLGADVLASLRSPEFPPVEAVVGVLINELAEVPGEVALVLDDYHLIDSEPVHEAVTFLLEHLPENTRLVIASRTDPPLPLARLRARDQIIEIRAADLRFTSDEASVFLKDVMGLALTASDVAALGEITEGWAAALQLAALSMRDREDVSGFVESFSGSNRHVLDFLAEEVLDQQPENVRNFLLQTSVLDRMTARLCDSLTGRSDGQEMLQRLESKNLFVVPLDDERRWYRYHHLFGDFLRGRIERESSERFSESHLRAASWYERSGWASEAVGHALAAGDDARAARLVEQNAQALFLRGEGATMDRWMSALPSELVRSRPRLSLARATWALINGRADEAEPLLNDADRALTTADDSHETPVDESASGLTNVPGVLAQLRAELARQKGNAELAIGFAQQALAHASEGDRVLRYLSRWDLAVATLMQGRVREAEIALSELVADPWGSGPNRYFDVHACYTLSQAQRGQSRLSDALETCRRALRLATEAGRPPLSVAGVAHVGLAEVMREQNVLDDALEHAAEGVALCRRLGHAQWLVTSLTVLSWVRQARGEEAGALEAIGEAEQAMPSLEVTVDMFFPVAVQRARLLLAQGEVAAAARWCDERALSVEDEPSYLREREYLILARVLLAGKAVKPEQARMLLERLLAAAEAAGRTGSVIEILALKAVALWAGHTKEPALDALTKALALAESEGYVRTFVDEGAQMAILLSALLESRKGGRHDKAGRVSTRYLAKLLSALTQEAGAEHANGRLAEPLSERELEVLVLVATGESNATIAKKLFVSTSTVKTHINNLYRKLGARSRTQAVARARELGLS